MKTIYNMLKVIYGSLIVWTYLVVMIGSFIYKILSFTEFPFPNVVYLIAGILLASLTIKFIKTKPMKKIEITTKHIVICSIILGIIQFILNDNRFFYCRWDAGVVLNTVYSEVTGDIESINTKYFSVFSNNLFLVYLFTTVAKLFSVVNIRVETALIFAVSVSNVLAAIFIYLLALKGFNDKKLAVIIYVIYEAYIGFSPWFLIAYSDQVPICLPVIMLYLACILGEKIDKNITFVLGFAIGFLALFGFYIKPQIFICFIALCLFGGCKVLQNWKSLRFGQVARPMVAGALGLLVCWLFVNQYAIPSLQINIDQSKTFGPLHFVMMGLNDETHGSYSEDDVRFSRSFADKKSREEAQKQEIIKRARNMGATGMISHLTQKQLATFGDGSFFWFGEGDFFVGKPHWNGGSFNNFLYKWIRPEKEFFIIFLTFCQTTWMLLLLGIVLGATVFGKEKNDLELMIMITIIGFMLFQLIFESRGRYVFCYSTVFVIMGVRGLYMIYYRLVSKSEKAIASK